MPLAVVPVGSRDVGGCGSISFGGYYWSGVLPMFKRHNRSLKPTEPPEDDFRGYEIVGNNRGEAECWQKIDSAVRQYKLNR
jgi:hypothetical protein